MADTNPFTAMGNYYKDIQDVEGMMSNQVQKVPMPPVRKAQAAQPVSAVATTPKPLSIGALIQYLVRQRSGNKARPTSMVGGSVGKPSQSFGDIQRKSLQQAILSHFGMMGE